MTFDEQCTKVEDILVKGCEIDGAHVSFYMQVNIEVLFTLYNLDVTPYQAVHDVMW